MFKDTGDTQCYMRRRKDVTVPMEQELCDKIDSNLAYNDSRSEWIREAVRLKLSGEQTDADVSHD